MKPYQFERIKTEINDVYAGNQSASKRYYLNSNSKSTERSIEQLFQKLNKQKSNENVLQLINMWHEHRQSLSITPLMPADTQNIQLIIQFMHFKIIQLNKLIVIKLQFLKSYKQHQINSKNDQSDVYFSTSDHNYQIPICKPHLTLDNLIKQNISEIYNLLDPSNKVLQSQKENKRTISKSKQSDNKLKTKEYLTTITLLSNAQKAVQQLYKNQDAAKAAEIDKYSSSLSINRKIQQVMFQIDKDFR